ncbi:hypothetical protein LTR12_010996 [Friedmanniomyces endolithicus]|nr:hypothetical protein LTR12_010996 [Friedmanniomyces endolithicus]
MSSASVSSSAETREVVDGASIRQIGPPDPQADDKEYERNKARVIEWLEDGQRDIQPVIHTVGMSCVGGGHRAMLREMYRQWVQQPGVKKRRTDSSRGGEVGGESVSGQAAEDEQVTATGANLDGDETPRRKRVKVDFRGRWKAILKIDTLAPPDYLNDHVDAHGADPARFFDSDPDNDFGRHLVSDQADNPISSVRALMQYSFIIARRLEMRGDADRARLLFLYMSIFMMMRAIDPTCTTHKVPDRVRATFAYLVSTVQEEYDDPTPDAAWDRIARYIRAGKKVLEIYSIAPAAPFFVAKYLTLDILVKRTPKHGTAEAMQHLKRLGIQEKARKYNAFAKALRRRLYANCAAAQPSDKARPIPSGPAVLDGGQTNYDASDDEGGSVDGDESDSSEGE